MSAPPSVSVVMPVHNAATVVADAIESILEQTFNDFEFIIVDDGSTDGTERILSRYAKGDNRIKLYLQAQSGLITTLNRYCRLAAGKYIARMDADDISLPMRLEKQFGFLEKHPDIGVLGTWIQDIDENRLPIIEWPVPADPLVVRWFLFFGNCIAHPSVMMRRDLVDRLGYYRPEAIYVEDYDLWIRAAEVTRLANLPEVLVQYRVSVGSISSRNTAVQNRNAEELKRELAASLIPDAADLGAADLITGLHDAYIARVRPDRRQKAEIALDAIRRLWILAICSRAPRAWLQSLRFVPQIFSSGTPRRIFSLGLWVLKYRRRAFVRQRSGTE